MTAFTFMRRYLKSRCITSWMTRTGRSEQPAWSAEVFHVAEVLVINRRPAGRSHPKLREMLHSDFFNLSPIEHERMCCK
jgi:hypothetical protein